MLARCQRSTSAPLLGGLVVEIEHRKSMASFAFSSWLVVKPLGPGRSELIFSVVLPPASSLVLTSVL